MAGKVHDEQSTQETGDAQVDRRAIANAQGAVEVVRGASETVDDQIASIDDRAGAQAEEIEAVVEEVSDLSATIEEVAASADQVAQRSDEAADRAADGKSAAADAMAVMEAVQETSEELAAEVRRLNDRIDTIETALAGIDDIAEQTNMLALNASIEAARAGNGDGSADGFAVVADEIKALASESQEQADTIETALAEVQTAADETVSKLEATTDEIETGVDHVADTMDEFEAVADTVERTAEDVQSVSTATDDLAESSETIAARSDEVADRAGEIESDISEIREAGAEQTTMLREVEETLTAVAPEANRSVRRRSTGVDGLDELLGGGLVVGGRSVCRHDGTADVDKLVATLCATALADGRAVSLTPTPTLDRRLLETALDGVGLSIEEAFREDRLFVLDMFDTWRSGQNVFDVRERGLSAVNEETDRRREAPLFVVGNIAGEIDVLGEETARAARYENDEGVLEDDDTVLNVIDAETVGDEFVSFYTGAADQVFATSVEDGTQHLEVTSAPAGRTGVKRRVTERSRPPLVELR